MEEDEEEDCESKKHIVITSQHPIPANIIVLKMKKKNCIVFRTHERACGLKAARFPKKPSSASLLCECQTRLEALRRDGGG